MRLALSASGSVLAVQQEIAAQAKALRQQHPNAGALIVNLRDYVSAEAAKAAIGEVLTVRAVVEVQTTTAPEPSVAEVVSDEDVVLPVRRRFGSR